MLIQFGEGYDICLNKISNEEASLCRPPVDQMEISRFLKPNQIIQTLLEAYRLCNSSKQFTCRVLVQSDLIISFVNTLAAYHLMGQIVEETRRSARPDEQASLSIQNGTYELNAYDQYRGAAVKVHFKNIPITIPFSS